MNDIGIMDYIVVGTVFYLTFGGFFAWMGAFWVCCALIVTAPIGALLCRYWARKQGLEASRCAWFGAFYWACGLMPWVHFAFQINGRMPPRGLLGTTYAVLFFVWFAGPISTTFFEAQVSHTEPPIWIPIANLLAFIAALGALGFLVFADELPETRERVQILRVIPSLLWTLAMLTWLPYRSLFLG